jgi:two-component system OmpR family response regulator
MVLSKKNFAASLTILLVERSAETRAQHSAGLAGLGYNVIVASRLEEARLSLESWPDLVVMDPALADGNGTDLLPAAVSAGIPLMIISQDQSVENRVLCLEQGAADFMVKPIDIRELTLRLATMTRLIGRRNSTQLVRAEGSGSFSVDLGARMVTRQDGGRDRLTEAEYRLLRLFLENPNRVLDRETISLQIEQRSMIKDSRSIDVLISKLRKKIDRQDGPSIISNVRNSGYVINIISVSDI